MVSTILANSEGCQQRVLAGRLHLISPDRRPEWEKAREREFILVANSLKTLKVTPEGGMSIDPQEFREQIITAREELKHLVHKPGAPNSPLKAITDFEVAQESDSLVEPRQGVLDCIEVVAWRRLFSGGAVRYTCLQCVSTGRFVVAAASLFSEGTESLPPWVDGNINRQVASAFQNREFHWYATVGEAMDAWDAAL